MSLSLEQNIEETTQQLLVDSSQSRQASKENFRAGERILEEVAKLQETIGQDAALVSKTRELAQLRTQQANLKIAQAAGLDPNAGVDEITKTISQLNQTNREVRSRIETVRAQREVSFFDDPGAWMKSIFTLPGEIEKLKGAANQATDLTTILDQTNKAIQNTAQSQNAINQALTSESIEANSRIVANLSEIKAREARLEGLKYNTLGVQASKNATKEDLDALYNQRNAQMQAAQFERLLEQLSLDKKKFEWQKEDRDLLRKIQEDARIGREEKNKLDEDLLDTINTGNRLLGYKDLTGLGVKNQLALFKEGKTSELNLAYELGRKYKALGYATYGTSPADSLKTLEQATPEIIQAKAETLTLFKQVKELVDTDPRVAGASGKDREAAFAQIFNKEINESIKRQFNNITPTENLFAVGDLSSYIGSNSTVPGIADLQSLGFTQKVLYPALSAGQSLSDPKIVMGLGLKALKAGLITSAELQSDLALIYRKANLINQEVKGFRNLGINLPENGKHYYVRLNPFGNPLDLTDPVSIGRYLNTQLASEKAMDAFKMPSGFGSTIPR